MMKRGENVTNVHGGILTHGIWLVKPLRRAAADLHGETAVAFSSQVSRLIASPALSPHISRLGGNELHTAGRSGCPNILQRFSSSSCAQRTPAGLPSGMPGIGLEMDGAMQQAPQPGRHA